MKKELLILIIVLSSSFNEPSKIYLTDDLKEKVVNSDKKFAFIKIPNEDEDSVKAKNYLGDIYIYNLIDSSTTRYTDDNYYKTELSFSPNGEKLIFASSSDSYNSINKDHSQPSDWISLFILDLLTGEIESIKMTPIPFTIIPFLSGLTWSNDGIYFSKLDNKIYKVEQSGNTFSIFVEINEEIEIFELSFSNNMKYLAIEYYSPNNSTSNLFVGLYNIDKKVFEDLKLKGNVGGWDKDDESFFVINRDSVYSYNITSKQKKYIPLQSNNDKLNVNNCFMLNEEEIIHTSSKNFYSKLLAEDIIDLDLKRAIGIENIKTNNLWYPIKNTHIIESFAPYGF